MFSSVPPVAKIDEGLNWKSQQINSWLQGWCLQQDFEFFNQEFIYRTLGLLATDRIHLSQSRKRILAQELAEFTEKPLNWIGRWKGTKLGWLEISLRAAQQ